MAQAPPPSLSKVFPRLFVGNMEDSTDVNKLAAEKISHMVRIRVQPEKFEKPKIDPPPKCLLIAAGDTPETNLSQYFSQCNDYIHEARISGGNVLVHCMAGISRSVTLTIAYLMTVSGHGWHDCYTVVYAGRRGANPNAGFQLQLRNFEGKAMETERERLRKKYPAWEEHADQEEFEKVLKKCKEANKEKKSDPPKNK